MFNNSTMDQGDYLSYLLERYKTTLNEILIDKIEVETTTHAGKVSKLNYRIRN